MILLRTLHRDIATYNQVPTEEEAKEETGWKLVHGDVFRKPNHSTLLSVLAGSGMQLLGMSVVGGPEGAVVRSRLVRPGQLGRAA
eukprot:g31317.t1